MNESFSDWYPALPGLIFSTAGFVLYHFITGQKDEKDGILKRPDNVKPVIFQRLMGVLVFGILPLSLLMILTGHVKISYIFGKVNPEGWGWMLGLCILIVIVNYLNAGNNQNLGLYPQIRKRSWSLGLLILSATSWIAYLLAYEILFRGLLFFPILQEIGLWPAIILNAGIYSLVHIPKGPKEALGAIPFGIILCLIVYANGSLWPAFIIHVVMALSNEWFSLAKHPEIHLAR